MNIYNLNFASHKFAADTTRLQRYAQHFGQVAIAGRGAKARAISVSESSGLLATVFFIALINSVAMSHSGMRHSRCYWRGRYCHDGIGVGQISQGLR